MRTILLILTAGLVLQGCGKKDSGDDSAGLGAAAGKSAAPVKPNPQMAADLGAVAQSVKANDYDKAVGTLVTLKDLPKTDAEQVLYRSQLAEAGQALAEKAKTDPRAQEAKRNLDRMIMGR